MKSLFLVFLAALALSACGGGKSIYHLSELPLFPSQNWMKPDGTSLSNIEAKKTFLECGALSPAMDALAYKQVLGIPLDDVDARFNLYFFVEACMERSGFRTYHASVKERCAYFPQRYAAFSACRSDAIFPERSVERRLNSWY